jgi:predicted nucleic acid-binding protein
MRELILLDCEGVQAVGNPDHPKHGTAFARLRLVAQRRARQRDIAFAVPTSVRVEAGWDRTEPTWAFANRLQIIDIPLDAAAANVAARLRTITGVSVADSHLGAAIATAVADRITVVTSDPDDMTKVADGKPVTVVPL